MYYRYNDFFRSQLVVQPNSLETWTYKWERLGKNKAACSECFDGLAREGADGTFHLLIGGIANFRKSYILWVNLTMQNIHDLHEIIKLLAVVHVDADLCISGRKAIFRGVGK